jgi:hypothetical protein
VQEKVLCLNPNPEKSGTRIARWKYELVRRLLLEAIPDEAPGITFTDLAPLVRESLSPAERDELGSVSWYTTTVKLDLEARGEIERMDGVSPQYLFRSRAALDSQEEAT